ncbi:MAG: hypothetical protein CVT59_04835 [Actinobacteria bacterium HGW-Actinobacteria-1]|jgi:glutaredoxin|nr:MAG: hypothetical protein CVT59_04835 [Actinobacteria bacterium HGW-Actinobacteria-1]
MSVMLYALSTCPYCRMTRKYLEENDVDFDLLEVDLLEGDERTAAIAKVKEISGGSSFPVIVIDDETIVGFNKKRIKELLGL